MFCALANGDTGITFTSKPLTFKGISIKPFSSIIINVLLIIGTIVSVINLPKEAPRFCASSFILSTTSVADLALMLSGGRLSSMSIFLILMTKSLITNCVTLKSPARGRGANEAPCGPPFLATGITAPGTILIVCGFNTPSSLAVYTPEIAMDAFFNNNSFVLFNVLISGNADTRGPLPYTSPATLVNRLTIHGLLSISLYTNSDCDFSWIT